MIVGPAWTSDSSTPAATMTVTIMPSRPSPKISRNNMTLNASPPPVNSHRRLTEDTSPRVSVSRLERYMKCPFQFYVGNVLQVEEEPEDEVSRSPLERGRFLWPSPAHGAVTITPAQLGYLSIIHDSAPPCEADLP